MHRDYLRDFFIQDVRRHKSNVNTDIKIDSSIFYKNSVTLSELFYIKSNIKKVSKISRMLLYKAIGEDQQQSFYAIYVNLVSDSFIFLSSTYCEDSEKRAHDKNQTRF